MNCESCVHFTKHCSRPSKLSSTKLLIATLSGVGLLCLCFLLAWSCESHVCCSGSILSAPCTLFVQRERFVSSEDQNPEMVNETLGWCKICGLTILFWGRSGEWVLWVLAPLLSCAQVLEFVALKSVCSFIFGKAVANGDQYCCQQKPDSRQTKVACVK